VAAISVAKNGGCPGSISIGIAFQLNIPLLNNAFPILEAKRTLSQKIPTFKLLINIAVLIRRSMIIFFVFI